MYLRSLVILCRGKNNNQDKSASDSNNNNDQFNLTGDFNYKKFGSHHQLIYETILWIMFLVGAVLTTVRFILYYFYHSHIFCRVLSEPHPPRQELLSRRSAMQHPRPHSRVCLDQLVLNDPSYCYTISLCSSGHCGEKYGGGCAGCACKYHDQSEICARSCGRIYKR